VERPRVRRLQYVDHDLRELRLKKRIQIIINRGGFERVIKEDTVM
jgi:hypothetical protein